MNSKPKVSVIVPVYNVEEYLVKCLDSLVKQTLKDIEIICINDGSTDNSLEILKAYSKNDSRIIIIDKENEGQGIARNLGISTASGEYIGFVDPDDWVDYDMYEKMYNQAESLSSDIVICDFIKYEDGSGKAWKHDFFWEAISNHEYANMDVPTGVVLDREVIYKSLLVSPCYTVNKIYKSEFLKENNIEFSPARCFEDCVFIIKSMILASNISYINEYFYKYRLRKNSTLHILNDFSQNFKAYEEIYNCLKTYNLEKTLKDNYEFFCTKNSIWTLPKLSPELQKEFLKALKRNLSSKCYKSVKQQMLRLKYEKPIKLANKLFYITNIGRHKVINIAGVRLKFKYFKGQFKKEQKFIKKIKKNQKDYQKDCYLLFDCLSDETVECIDAYTLFQYLETLGEKAYYVVLKNTELYHQLEAQNKLKHIIGLDKSSKDNPGDFFESIYDILLKTKAVITSFGENSTAANRFFKQNPYWQYIFIQHGQIFMPTRTIETNYLYPEKFDKFLVSSENERNILKKYGWEENKLIKAGLPRWDLLPKNKQSSEKSILIMFTWRRHNLISFENSLYKKNLLRLLNNKELNTFLEERNIKLYFAPHHALSTNQGINFTVENNNINIISSQNISKYIKQCSCLITDFSSVSFDFMFQNKPVILYILDKDDITLNPLEQKGINSFDYKKYIIPNVYYEEDEVIEKLKYYVENDFELEPETKQKYDKFFYTKENIRQKLVEEINKICKP